MHTSMRMPALAVGLDSLFRHQMRLLASITAVLHSCSQEILQRACVSVWTLLIRLGEGALRYGEAGLGREGSHSFLVIRVT